MADMVERLQAAIALLDEHIRATAETGVVSPQAVVLALRILPAVRNVLRHDLGTVEASEGEQLARVLSAFERAGDAAVVSAILSGAPLLPSERARVAVFGLDKPEEGN